MNSQGKTTHSTEILRHKTKNSILKAIAQSHDVIQQITNNKTEEIAANKNNYLIVVTFKELYLGNGQTYYEAIAKAKMDTIYENQRGYSRIPPENMFFMTIDDLDILADLLKKKSYTFPDILEMAKKNDSRQESKKFTFSQHIYTLHTTPQTPDYLMLEKNSIFDRIKQNVSDTR
ncbi:hypothetical protein [Saccharophagus degradans]|uniref:KilA-N DNA-binding domain-containing protein n=1 Tax=Saccharophagus degradans TaxID=86304 RepID=A0AAW7X418_9GAMM|nr:hypothetical protein [Saccharophagus degradans]MDO6422297.1 hypothetical protein [Saccharophagus degradans]MDO6607428.1 hypothetical protein [Saccharophagus degradans]